MRAPSDALQEYLETIYELEEENIPPLRARLVERLGLSAPTVSEGVTRLEADGLLNIGDDRVIRLTARGRQVAIDVVRRHRLAERLLVDVIGLPWSQAHREASRWEHVISPAVEHRIVELLGDPGACPHGNPIPGSANRPSYDEVAVADVAPGAVDVVRISEELEPDDEALELLERAGFIPGQHGRVISVDANGAVVRGTNEEVALTSYIARLTYVVPA